MTNRKMKVGDTLGQRDLAMRANYSTSTIRRRGDEFNVFIHGDKVAWREVWRKRNYSNGSFHCYQLVEIEAYRG